MRGRCAVLLFVLTAAGSAHGSAQGSAAGSAPGLVFAAPRRERSQRDARNTLLRSIESASTIGLIAS